MIRTCSAAVAVLLLGGGAAGVRSPRSDVRFEYSEPHMGTLVRITLYARDEPAAARASASAFERIARLDAALSDYRDDSELTGLSRRSGSGPIAIGDDLFRVLAAAQEIARASDGAFDVTAGPLSVLWRQARRHGRLPDAARLAEARRHVGHEKLELNAAARTAALREAGMQLDLGGIAKGFAADEAIAALAATGVARALVACGGDVRASAAPPGEPGWRVTIATIDGAAPGSPLLLERAAVSTSGDAEQFVVVDGARYSHIYDPRSGMALTGRRSVTVRADTATASDALATAVSVMGAARGLPLVDATPGAAALYVEDAGHGIRTHTSSRWRGEAR